jgi:single-strand DNA-binding protein
MAMSLNRAQIIGNLTRDPELRNTTSGQSVCNFSVATSSQWTDASGQKQERTEYHPVVAWGKLAEICQQYLGKGRKVYVEGRLQTREWETPDAQKRQRTEIVADNMIMLDKAGQGSTPSSAPSASGPSTTNAPDAANSPTVDPGMGEQEIRIEDIPF